VHVNHRTTNLALAALLGASLIAGRAQADEKNACIAASEKAQSLRDDRKLLEAREQFLACAREACPAAVRKDCADQVADLVKRTPSVVFHAKDRNGQDLVAVKVTSDGKVLTEQLDGRSLPLDPGVHTFRFEAAGNEPLEEKIVLAEGEHDRAVNARFGGGAVEASTGGGPATSTAAPAKKGAPIGAFVVGGVGIVAMGVGATFYALAFSQKSSDQSATGCAPPNGAGCPQSEIDSIKTKLVVGDIVFYTGVAALAGGLVWAIVHYASGGHEQAAPVATVDVAPTAFGRGAVASTTIRW
jgi:hypothetical protein